VVFAHDGGEVRLRRDLEDEIRILHEQRDERIYELFEGRKLAHDLSNSLETILQAAYLLGQAELDANSRKWTHMIDQAAHDAARLSREVREILRKQS